MKNIHLIALGLVSAATVLIAGCASQSGLNKNYSFKKNDNHGLAAVSVECRGSNATGELWYKSTKNTNDNDLQFSCDDQPYYYLVELPAGNYHFYNVDLLPTYQTAHFRALDFQIYPHRVTYVGNVNVLFTQDKKFGVAVVDKSARDLNYFQSHYKNIPQNSYKIQLAQFGKKLY